jgi:hypothetical protein
MPVTHALTDFDGLVNGFMEKDYIAKGDTLLCLSILCAANRIEDGLLKLASAIDGQRSDHPLQGETFTALVEAIGGIGDAIQEHTNKVA